MASTVPAKSQSLHNFALPRLKWKNNHPRGGRSSSAGTRESPPSQSGSPLRNHSTIRNSPLHGVGGGDGGGGGYGGGEAEGSGKGRYTAEYKRHGKNNDRRVEKSEKSKALESDNGVNLNGSDNKGNDKEPRSRILIKIPASMRNSGNSKVKEEENQVMIDEQKAWNLRPRRPVKKSFNVDDGVGGRVGLKAVQEKKDQLKQESFENGVRVRVNGVEKEKKVKFSVALTRQEIEEDVYSLTGSKASRRPKKRAKAVQKHLDNVFPGQLLATITADSYKVSEHSMKG